jgi:hypothetical protein
MELSTGYLGTIINAARKHESALLVTYNNTQPHTTREGKMHLHWKGQIMFRIDAHAPQAIAWCLRSSGISVMRNRGFTKIELSIIIDAAKKEERNIISFVEYDTLL